MSGVPIEMSEAERKAILRLKKNKDKSRCMIANGVLYLGLGAFIAIERTFAIGLSAQLAGYSFASLFLVTVGVFAVRDAISDRKMYLLVDGLLRKMSTDIESVARQKSTAEAAGSGRR